MTALAAYTHAELVDALLAVAVRPPPDRTTGEAVALITPELLRRERAAMRAAGRTPQRVMDPRFGEVNTYPEELLRRHFGDEAAVAV